MKHFGHECAAFEDKRIQRLTSKHGLAGYGFYFVCLELIGQKIKKNNVTCELEYEPVDLAFKLRIEESQAKAYLETCLQVGLFWQDDRTGKIYCFKLLSRLEKNIGYNAEFKAWIKEFEESELYKYYLSTIKVLEYPNHSKQLTNGSVLNGSKPTVLNPSLPPSVDTTVLESKTDKVGTNPIPKDIQRRLDKIAEYQEMLQNPKYGSDMCQQFKDSIKMLQGQIDDINKRNGHKPIDIDF